MAEIDVGRRTCGRAPMGCRRSYLAATVMTGALLLTATGCSSKRQFTVSGTVVFANKGEELPMAAGSGTVELVRPRETAANDISLGGRFRLLGVDPGSYSLETFLSPQGPYAAAQCDPVALVVTRSIAGIRVVCHNPASG